MHFDAGVIIMQQWIHTLWESVGVGKVTLDWDIREVFLERNSMIVSCMWFPADIPFLVLWMHLVLLSCPRFWLLFLASLVSSFLIPATLPLPHPCRGRSAVGGKGTVLTLGRSSSKYSFWHKTIHYNPSLSFFLSYQLHLKTRRNTCLKAFLN